MKLDSFRFCLPVWTWEELQELNQVRQHGSPTLHCNKASFTNVLICLAEFWGLFRKEKWHRRSIVSMLGKFYPMWTVREKDYSHRLLCIVPSEDFRTILHLDFYPNILLDDSIHEISAFYVANSEDNCFHLTRRIMAQCGCIQLHRVSIWIWLQSVIWRWFSRARSPSSHSKPKWLDG